MNQIAGYFTHVIFESADGERNVYNFAYDLDKGKQNKIPVLMPTRQDITGEVIIINGNVRYNKKFGVQFVADNVIKGVMVNSHNSNNSLHELQDSSSPPEMPKEYYDSMLIEYCNEQEKLYDFFTPED